jgi:hypothetical protein
MKAALITTLHHNVGDDFVREGILFLLRRVWKTVHPLPIHKHMPISARERWTWVARPAPKAWLERLPGHAGPRGLRWLDRLPVRRAGDRILAADVVVQCGAPIYWCHAPHHCARNEWFRPLIRDRLQRMAAPVPFVSLAGGTCQPYGSTGEEVAACPGCARYIRAYQELAACNTVRDRLAQAILHRLGLDSPLIPCASLFAAEGLGIPAEEPQFVCLNYMPGAGHYDFLGEVDAARWEATFSRFCREVSQRSRCILVCHNAREVKAARRLDASIEVFHAQDPAACLRLYSRARFGIVNRVHAAFAMAGFGRPSFVIGTDSRARMAKRSDCDMPSSRT